ncbi:MAG: hypothetical protein M0Z31_05655 [Clostridia bacterium]|nr:hypothetical protein [Clostridia bacterium]
MSDKNQELMRKLIEEKKQKSSNQSGGKRGPDNLGNSRPGIKKHKKGGLFDK